MDTFKYQPNDVLGEKNIFDTTKMFFGKYLCRVEFSHTAARLLYDIGDMSYCEFSKFIRDRNAVLKTASKNKYCRRESDLATADAAKLYCINEMLCRHSDQAKIVIRGTNVRAYLSTVGELECFVHCSAGILAEQFISIYRPKDEESTALLQNNVIFVNNPKYNYKITIHEGKYNVELKHRIAEYLMTADPGNVYLTPRFSELLANENPYVYGSFFANDPAIALFATIIEPKFINKIYRLKETSNK